MKAFAETLRKMIPFEQRAHSRILTDNEASILEGVAHERTKRVGYQAAQVRG